MFSADDPDRLVAFALGLRQGDHVEYRSAASTRDVRGPVGYGLVWHLMEWGREVGASWFDFGGLPNPSATPPELAGIVRFKESFGGEPLLFREEFVLETRPVLSSLRRRLSGVAAAVRNLSVR
jgi:lipid II:glycine glycyltransferase (peptidoglycan interpeptide bridge formation enzyme)